MNWNFSSASVHCSLTNQGVSAASSFTEGGSLTSFTCLLPQEDSSLREHFLFLEEERGFKVGKKLNSLKRLAILMPTWKAIKVFQNNFEKSGH